MSDYDETPTRYQTRNDAIQAEIIDPIQQGDSTLHIDATDDYDVDAIAAQVLDSDDHGWFCRVEPDAFWAIVADNDTTVPALVGRRFFDPAGSGSFFEILRAGRRTITTVDEAGEEWILAYELHEDDNSISLPADWQSLDPTAPNADEDGWWAPATPFVPDETIVSELAREWRIAQHAESGAREAIARAARIANDHGMSAYRLGQVTGAASDTVAKWLRG